MNRKLGMVAIPHFGGARMAAAVERHWPAYVWDEPSGRNDWVLVACSALTLAAPFIGPRATAIPVLLMALAVVLVPARTHSDSPDGKWRLTSTSFNSFFLFFAYFPLAISALYYLDSFRFFAGWLMAFTAGLWLWAMLAQSPVMNYRHVSIRSLDTGRVTRGLSIFSTHAASQFQALWMDDAPCRMLVGVDSAAGWRLFVWEPMANDRLSFRMPAGDWSFMVGHIAGLKPVTQRGDAAFLEAIWNRHGFDPARTPAAFPVMAKATAAVVQAPMVEEQEAPSAAKSLATYGECVREFFAVTLAFSPDFARKAPQSGMTRLAPPV